MTTPTSPTRSSNPLQLPIDSPDAPPGLARLLCYGKPKTRKTWWAGTASQTHRVTILDGENGTGIWNQLPPNTRQRITRIPLTTQVNRPSMSMFCALLFTKQSFIWSLAEEREVSPSLATSHPDEWFIHVNLSALTHADVLILDSWTKLSGDTALQYMHENRINPFEGKKREFDHYGYQDLVLDAMLSNINCISAHLVVIGHEQYYKFEVKDGLVKKEINRVQIISSTGKHAAKLPAAIGDVLWFEAKGPGTNSAVGSIGATGSTTIYTGATEYRDGGARTIPPAKHEFPGWGWQEYCVAAGYRIPSPAERDAPNEAFVAKRGSEFGAPAASAKAAYANPQLTTSPAASKPTFLGLRK